MKYWFLILMVIVLSGVSAQTVDSIVIKQVDSLIQVSRDLTANKDFDKALEVSVAAEKLALKKFGPESTAYESCCFSHGRVFHIKGDFVEAEKWFIKGKAIQEKTSGKDHPNYAISLTMLADLYYDMGQYKKAEPFYLEVKGIREKTLGKDHPDYAFSLNMLAVTYWAMGQYEKAMPLFIESKAIREKVLGKEHPDYAESLNNLAMLFQTLSQYEKAEPLLLESKAIQEKTLGKKHLDYIRSLNNLALLYQTLGQYEKAEPISLEVKILYEKVLGKEHPYYAIALNNLAVLYSLLGQKENSKQLHLEVKNIREKTLGKEHPDYASTLSSLAMIYKDMGDYDKAEPFILEAKAIQEKALGKEHPMYSLTLNNLGSLYVALRNYEKAESLFLESITIRGQTLDSDHRFYSMSLNNLANLYSGLGLYEKAEPLHLEAMSIREKALGREHPEYSMSLNNLARCYEMQGRFNDSEPLLKEFFELTESRLSKSTAFLSERELGNFAANFQESGENLSAYLLARTKGGGQSSSLPALLYNQALFQKGFLLTAARRLNSLTTSSAEAEELNNQLKGYRRQIAQQLTKPIAEHKGLEELEKMANFFEKELARTVAGYGDALRQVEWQEVQKSLNLKEVSIEFIHFKVNFPKTTDSTIYAALVLRSDLALPLFIPLFEERELNYLLDAGNEHKADYVNELYARANRGLVKLGSEKKSLYALIWEKIQAEIPEGTRTIYYSPSGVLHRLNLGAIALDETTILSDRFNLVEMNSTRQLVIPDDISRSSSDALLVGGVQFDVDPTLQIDTNATIVASRSISAAWTESGPRQGAWSPLTWTGREVESISTSLLSSAFKVIQYAGTEATEEAIKAIGKDSPSPRVLHLATHGFFFPDPKARNENWELGDAEPVFKVSDNPMVRSGLVLAGGNYAWQHGHAPKPDMEDGILTAYEISQMNLSNTELVVLSACETGLGDIQGNEGVYGLQRAFKIAGAKYLIMSLWQVPDRQTMQFMTTFYRHWLEAEGPDKGGNKLTIPEAFRKTQLEMRDRFFDAYNWAGFVLVE